MEHRKIIEEIVKEIGKVIIGKRESTEIILCAILSQGHVLIEDIPGVGKTTLALALAKVMDLESNRTQFTPDVMPSDIIGFTLYRKETGRFEFQPGAVMCNLYLADEINRTSPKTQSALLEVMEENAVTVDAVTHPVPSPFVVIATENPLGYAGTQPLPESQLDRFSVSVSLGYTAPSDEILILKNHSVKKPIDQCRQVIDKSILVEMQEQVKRVHISDEIYQYIVGLAVETRNNPGFSQGMSIRGTLDLTALSRAMAYMQGRDYVIPDDVVRVFEGCVRHRLILSVESKVNHRKVEDVIREMLRRVEKPAPERMKLHG